VTLSKYILIEIPREVLHAARMTPIELRRELATSLFEQGRLSFGKARETAGMSFWAFQQTLGSREIPIHYEENEYEEDLKHLKELGQ
jgi:predicted HTH domain antitoxin